MTYSNLVLSSIIFCPETGNRLMTTFCFPDLKIPKFMGTLGDICPSVSSEMTGISLISTSNLQLTAVKSIV